MTEVLRVDLTNPDPDIIARAAACLRRGGLVAFPTETVYGLGVHALDSAAVLNLFAAKERPANDPLIVHVTSVDDLALLVAEVPATARELAARFWPGPLTIVMRRSAAVPDAVTAGLATVAIRVPSHPVARALIAAARIPVAAPSANLFSRPSPTAAAHVMADLGGRIDMILDAGPTHVGVESTVVDVSQDPPVILRPGVIGFDLLRTVMPHVGVLSDQPAEVAMPSPGLLTRHYSPHTPLLLYEGSRAASLALMERDARHSIDEGKRVVVLAFAEDIERVEPWAAQVVRLGNEANSAEVAARLYAALREADACRGDVILMRTLTSTDALGIAIGDRLRRAAAGRVVRE